MRDIILQSKNPQKWVWVMRGSTVLILCSTHVLSEFHDMCHGLARFAQGSGRPRRLLIGTYNTAADLCYVFFFLFPTHDSPFVCVAAMRPLFSYSTLFVALVLGSLQSLAAPGCHHHNANTPKLKESVPPPHNWIDLGRAPPAQAIPLRIALPQMRFDELERHLYETSDPYHARYGQHLLKEQVEELVKPASHSVDAVDAWLTQYGITRELLDARLRATGLWLTFPLCLRRRCLTP